VNEERDVGEFGVSLPPNARISRIALRPQERAMQITLEDGPAQRLVDARDVRAFYGARIRHETIRRAPKQGQRPSLGGIGAMAVTGVPINPSAIAQKYIAKDEPLHGEELHYVLGMRVAGIGELWYLLAASFNFRSSLGAQATYSTELNLRALVDQLGTFAPDAVQDSFFTALSKRLPLPPPLGSLIEFFRIASG
jgi:hypothetical protein